MKQLLIAAVGGLLVLTACSAPQDPASSPAPASAAPAAANEDPDGTMGGNLSPRGAQVEQVGGQAATIQAASGAFILDFTVDSITPDAPCVDRWPDGELENGHFLAVAVTVKTRPTYEKTSDPLSFSNFSYVSDDGEVTDTLYSFVSNSCKVKMLPGTLLPSSTYRGVVMLDVPATSGTLVLNAGESALVGDSNVFEWAF